MNLLIGIPAYNEESKLKNIIKSLPDKLPGISRIDTLVVDDGSQDSTASTARSAGVVVVRHLINRGLGGSLKTIFEYARKYNYDFLLTFDADGQHNPEDIKQLLLGVLKKNCDVVIGSRWLGKGRKSPILRYFINRLANIYTYLLYGCKTSDSQSGLRAFNKKAVSLINLTSDGMEVSSEFFREIYRHKLIFREVPISLIYTDYSLKKGQRITNASGVFLRLILRLFR